MGEKVLTSRMGFFNEDLQGNLRHFERMEIAEQVYKGKSPSKTIIRAYANCDSHVRKKRGENPYFLSTLIRAPMASARQKYSFSE